MDDEWDETCDVVVQPPPQTQNTYGMNDVDEGHSLSRGRGFPIFIEENDDYNKGSNGFEERRGRGGRGFDRGGRGRGGRGGRGGRDRGYENGGENTEDGDRGDRYERGERGRGRGRGRGGGGRGGGRPHGEGGDTPEEAGEEKKTPVTYVPPEPTENEDEIFSSTISSGINFDKFDCIAVKVTGENPPRAIDSFETANLRKYVLDNILKSGYKKPTPIQKHAIPIIMNGRDLMGCAQTGSGKTAAFLLPIINTLLQDLRELVVESNGCAQPQVVIVAPTRELTLQIFNEARKFSYGSVLKIAVAYGGTAVRHQGDNISRGCHILVATPGRLHDFVDRNRVSFGSVRFVVLDEADRMLDMGFMPSVEKMMDHPTMVQLSDRQTLMFSATFPEDIQHLAGRFLNNYLFVAVGVVGGASTDVEQIFHQVTKYEKQNMLKKLIEDNDGKRILVFVETKRNADFIAAMLSEQQMLTSSIHGDRMQREREEALHNFKSGRHFILVATAVAARGLDIKNVDIVVNYDLPKSIDEYVHRIGRTGRVGNRGKAVSFFDSDQDVALAADLGKILRQAEQPVPDFLQGGGGGIYKGNKYGGSDIRNFNNASTTVEQGQEPDEEWWGIEGSAVGVISLFNEARKFSYGSVLKIAVAYGGTAVRHQGDNISRGCHILVATPGRLHDFVDRNRVSFGSVRFVVLDEADHMLDMGFMPSVEKMMDHPTMVQLSDRQTLMFSATFPEDIQHLAGRFLNNYLFVAVGVVGGASTDVEQIFHQVTKYEKQNMLKKLIEDNDGKRILVFVETKRNADFIAAMLSEQQMLTSSIHGDRMQREREEALHNFKSGRHFILVATAVAARGLDIKNVDIVVNYDLPKSIDEYVHRIGRTGRVGNRGKAVSFFDSDQDVALAADLGKILRQAEQPVPDFLQGGGGGIYKGNKYGGSDIRNFNNASTTVEQGQEPDEEW